MQDLVVLDWIEILEKIRSHATSEAAREAVMLTKPLSTPEECYASFQEIANATEVLNQGVRPYMQSLDLYSTWITRLKKNAVLKTLEIKDVRSFCLEALALREALSQRPVLSSLNFKLPSREWLTLFVSLAFEF